MKIEYPYLPEGREIKYVDFDNKFMREAFDFALKFEGVIPQIIGAILVKDDKVIGRGSIAQGYHSKHGCQRVHLNLPQGTGYDKCPGCHTDNHSEPNAIKDAKSQGHDTKGADLYLWGHWWCCQSCWGHMIKAGVKNVYLLENSQILFNRYEKGCILNRQFDYFREKYGLN